MDSRTRLLTAIAGEKPDHVPLYCWVFGFKPPKDWRWQAKGREVTHWYTMRLEHIHTLPQKWDIQRDFLRVDRWLSLGLDDVLEVSVPWSVHPDVKIRDWQQPPSPQSPYTILCREYDTPAGVLRHLIRQTDEEQGEGWVIQPDHPELFEDFNIPRGVEHAVTSPSDLPKLRYLLCDPTSEQLDSFCERMTQVEKFADDRKVLVQGWSAFGMDGVVWLCGMEGAVITAVENPAFFQELVDAMYDFDGRRTEIMLDVGGVDIVVQRGWYSSTPFWSPTLFRRFVLPHLKDLVNMAHQAGALFAYVMTTGLMAMLDELKDAGIDLLYFVDPVQDDIDLKLFKQRLGGKFAIAGGINSGVTLGSGTPDEIRQAVYSAVDALAEGGGFILSPVDALFPDTPADSVKAMIEAWREVCEYPV
ncbi:MAG: uroporphyrinogen decarboxylase family protein [Candidatus Poribacteria bacterium]